MYLAWMVEVSSSAFLVAAFQRRFFSLCRGGRGRLWWVGWGGGGEAVVVGGLVGWWVGWGFSKVQQQRQGAVRFESWFVVL
jgi:hypothetical protein